jgi:hypothetical protein
MSEGLNEAGLGISANWDTTVTGYEDYSGTADTTPRSAISFSVSMRDRRSRQIASKIRYPMDP